MNNEKSWVVKAIEKEAMARAVHALGSLEPSMFGLSPKQVMALMEFYRKSTGNNPDDICDPR